MTMQNSKSTNTKTIAKRYRNFDFCFLHFNFHSCRSVNGFTLLETIVALAVIMAAVVGPVSLITRGLTDFSFAKNKIAAINLAQEGIELIRAVRENNILCDSLNGAPPWAWNSDPEGGNLTNTKRQVSAANTVTINCKPPGPGGALLIITPRLPLSVNEALRFDSATGLYGYTGQNTIFTREITICLPPNSGGGCNATPDSDIPASSQMEVISRVTWTDRGVAQALVLRERLYEWR